MSAGLIDLRERKGMAGMVHFIVWNGMSGKWWLVKMKNFRQGL